MKNMVTKADKPMLLSLKSAAVRLGVSPLTLRRMIMCGAIKAIRLGPKLLMLRAAEVERLVDRAPTIRPYRKKPKNWGTASID